MTPPLPAPENCRVKMPRLFVLALLAMFLATFALGDADARADVDGRLARLSKLRGEAERGRGPEVYGALRRLWLEWDQGDPAEVEESLRAILDDARVSAPARAYAGLLEAYARRRRGDLDGARARVSRLGYVGRWLVSGPFDNEGKAGLARAFGPEEDTPCSRSTQSPEASG